MAITSEAGYASPFVILLCAVTGITAIALHINTWTIIFNESNKFIYSLAEAHNDPNYYCQDHILDVVNQENLTCLVPRIDDYAPRSSRHAAPGILCALSGKIRIIEGRPCP